MLHQLVEYSQRIARPPVLYSLVTIRYAIVLDGSGRLLNEAPVKLDDAMMPLLQGRKLLIPQVQKTSGIRANLLNGNAEYTLGIGRARSQPERVRRCHTAYVELVRRCAEQTGEGLVRAVLTFLEGNPRGVLKLPIDFTPESTIIFQVDGINPTDLPSIQAFWAAENDPANQDAPVMQCLVCGYRRPVLRVLQQRIRGVPNGQTAGTSIISANAEAFESYGLHNSLIAPTCAACADGFTTGLNHLLRHQASHLLLGGAACIGWTRDDRQFPFRDYFDRPTPEVVRSLLQKATSGNLGPEIDHTEFYATVLSGSGGRAVVREWIHQTVGKTEGSIAAWFEDQAVVDRDGDEPRPLGLFPLAAATVRDASKDLSPPAVCSLLRAALTGTPVPLVLLARVVWQNRADGTVTHSRAALIKLVLARQGMSREEVRRMAQLVPEHPSWSYHCGRLLAVLEAVERAALGPVSSTIANRYFATASSVPGSIFPSLIRRSAFHLTKLRRTRPARYEALRRRMEEVREQLPDLQSVLSLKDQGFFALGFYHQRAHDRWRAREAAERRRATSPRVGPMSTANADDLAMEDLA